jgi:hypothetical protein
MKATLHGVQSQIDAEKEDGNEKGTGNLFLTGAPRFQTKSMGLAIRHFAARGGEVRDMEGTISCF